MILAIVTEEVDELGRRRYVATLAELVDEDEEKTRTNDSAIFSIMAMYCESCMHA